MHILRFMYLNLKAFVTHGNLREPSFLITVVNKNKEEDAFNFEETRKCLRVLMNFQEFASW